MVASVAEPSRLEQVECNAPLSSVAASIERADDMEAPDAGTAAQLARLKTTAKAALESAAAIKFRQDTLKRLLDRGKCRVA